MPLSVGVSSTRPLPRALPSGDMPAPARRSRCGASISDNPIRASKRALIMPTPTVTSARYWFGAVASSAWQPGMTFASASGFSSTAKIASGVAGRSTRALRGQRLAARHRRLLRRRFAQLGPRRLRVVDADQRHHFRRRQRQTDIVDAERIGHGIRDARRRAHVVALAESLRAERRERRRRLQMHDHRIGHFARGRHQVVGERAGLEAAVRAIAELLHQRRARDLARTRRESGRRRARGSAACRHRAR